MQLWQQIPLIYTLSLLLSCVTYLGIKDAASPKMAKPVA